MPAFLSSRYPLLKWLAGLAVLVSPGAAGADTLAPSESQDKLAARRYEFLPVPDIGGNSDVGVEFGVVFTLARFYDDARPYKWLFGGTLGTSFKNDANGFRLVQHYHAFRLDVPNLFGGRVRLDTRAHFLRNIIARWEGTGNASTAEDAPGDADPLRNDEYIAQEVRLRSVARVKTGTPFDAAFTTSLRYVFPSVYQNSKLAHDIANSNLPGTENAFLGSLGAGIFLDTRDDEFVPHEGVFYQVGVLGTAGTAERVGFGEASAVLQSYIPLGPKMTFGSRLMASFLFGRVPFYELQSGSVFNPTHMVGGERGLRGIPEARYAGHIKVLANYELRTDFIPRFRVLSWQLQIGTTTFFDVGRVWNDWDSSVSDGSTPGIKYSVGGGFYFQWDRSSVFRVEVAHSPTDHAPDEFPLAYYLANGLIF
ncbi:BamA/TamA family outer membrane protein [Pendulispora rubella]|uniref:BamA/TamA family outer membrane protein n=1 Tax=Pendulispora rubella TaxID=2741070 RepID=A0ABZ2LDU3_9BACT